jgi:type II secretory pathway pseudopilin PulG
MKTWAVVLIFGLLLGCGGGNPAPAPQSKAPDETAALAAMRNINNAQTSYFTRNRRYALTYEELMEARALIEEPTVAGTGYEIKMRPSPDAVRYTVSAVPVSPAAAARHFFTDQTGIIRSEEGKDATVQSPEIK